MLPEPEVAVADATHPRASASRHPGMQGITPRALIVGTALVPLLCFWNAYSDIVAQSTELAVMSLSIGVVFVLLVLLLVNFALKRWAPPLAMTQAELMFIYVMQTASVCISSVGMT